MAKDTAGCRDLNRNYIVGEINLLMNRIKAALYRIRNASSPVKASFAFALCSIIQKSIQFLTVPIFTRLMSTEQFGEVNVYQSWMSILTIIATFNLASGCFNKGMLKYQDDRDGFTSSMQGLSFIITTATLIVFVIIQFGFISLIDLPNYIIAIMFLELYLQPAIGFWSARQRFEFKYKALFIVTLIISFTNAILGVVGVISFEEKGQIRIVTIALTNVAIGLFLWIINLNKGRKLVDLAYWKFALMFNIPLIPHYLSSVVLSSSDRLMIEWMFTSSEVAVYSVSYSVGIVMSIVISSINASFVPTEFICFNEKEYSKTRKLSTGLVALMAVVTIIPIMFGPELVRILGTEEYYDAIWVIPPVANGIFLTFLYSLFANVEFYYEKTKYVMFASVIAAIANIFMNYIFMKKFGYIAAGYTTFACYGLMTILHYIFMRKIVKDMGIEGRIYDIKHICLITIILVILSSLMLLTYNITHIRYLVIAVIIFGIVYKRQSIVSIIESLLSK